MKLLCLHCGHYEGIELVFGLAETAMMESAERGEIALGGCSLLTDPGPIPDSECQRCWTRWKSGAWSTGTL